MLKLNLHAREVQGSSFLNVHYPEMRSNLSNNKVKVMNLN